LFANPDDRPDALLIMDDTLVEAAGEGLLAAGVRSPQDVTVIAHCNFPYFPKSPVPLSFLGFDSRKILEQLITVVKRCRAGTIEASEQTLIPSHFEALGEDED
jgi:DNA-binding LacI/PurR family transcriptional regulator